MEYSFMHKIVVPNTILIVDDDDFVVHLSGPVRRWINQRPRFAQIRLPAVFFLRLIPLKWLKMEKSVSIKY